jgi:3',5'-cyclic AMP phosphodiesterase CpdA
MTRLFALSDLHVQHAGNRAAVEAIPAHPRDWLLVPGDIGESVEVVARTLGTLASRWERVFWTPGNHELWTARDGLRGRDKYDALVDAARAVGVRTPEDPYERFPGADGPWICPLFLLYDYSFSPPGFTPEQAVAWAAEDGIRCADEQLLEPWPYPSRAAWCAARLAETERRLFTELPAGARTVLVAHWSLRIDLVRTYRIPRFLPWCGTLQTHDWHRRFGADVVVSGHLHMRATDWRDGTRFEEVSLGYPRHWDAAAGAAHYLREVLPGPPAPPDGVGGPVWHR